MSEVAQMARARKKTGHDCGLNSNSFSTVNGKATAVLGMIEHAYDEHKYSMFLGNDRSPYASCLFSIPNDCDVEDK